MEYIAIGCNSGDNKIYFAHENYLKNESEKRIRVSDRIRHYICAVCNKGKFFYIIKTGKLSIDKCLYCGSEFKINKNFDNDSISCDIIPHSL